MPEHNSAIFDIESLLNLSKDSVDSEIPVFPNLFSETRRRIDSNL